MKLQMKFQKILLIVSIIMAAVCIFYSFAYFTGSLSTLYYYLNSRRYPINCENTYYFAQDFNGTMLMMSIVYLLMIVALYLAQCGKRRNYYITNYVVSIVAAVYIAVFAIVCFAMNASIMSMFLNEIDWDAYRRAFETVDPISGKKLQPYYDDSVIIFILGFIVHLLALVNAVAIVVNLLWKRKLMKGEQQLLTAETSEKVSEEEVA